MTQNYVPYCLQLGLYRYIYFIVLLLLLSVAAVVLFIDGDNYKQVCYYNNGVSTILKLIK